MSCSCPCTVLVVLFLLYTVLLVKDNPEQLSFLAFLIATLSRDHT
jgi:hypothetical protein